jgi:hypothetical protein
LGLISKARPCLAPLGADYMRWSRPTEGFGLEALRVDQEDLGERAYAMPPLLCLSEIKLGYIGDEVRLELESEEYAVCTENLIRVDEMTESPKLKE